MKMAAAPVKQTRLNIPAPVAHWADLRSDSRTANCRRREGLQRERYVHVEREFRPGGQRAVLRNEWATQRHSSRRSPMGTASF